MSADGKKKPQLCFLTTTRTLTHVSAGNKPVTNESEQGVDMWTDNSRNQSAGRDWRRSRLQRRAEIKTTDSIEKERQGENGTFFLLTIIHVFTPSGLLESPRMKWVSKFGRSQMDRLIPTRLPTRYSTQLWCQALNLTVEQWSWLVCTTPGSSRWRQTEI